MCPPGKYAGGVELRDVLPLPFLVIPVVRADCPVADAGADAFGGGVRPKASYRDNVFPGGTAGVVLGRGVKWDGRDDDQSGEGVRAAAGVEILAGVGGGGGRGSEVEGGAAEALAAAEALVAATRARFLRAWVSAKVQLRRRFRARRPEAGVDAGGVRAGVVGAEGVGTEGVSACVVGEGGVSEGPRVTRDGRGA